MKATFWRRLFKPIGLTIVIAIAVSIAYVEFQHRYNFGHFVPYRFHVDGISRNVSSGIPGQTKMYAPQLSNFTFLPVSLEGCDYIDDAFGHGTTFPYGVQRWDRSANRWQTISQPGDESSCRPVPLSMIETKLVWRRLW